MRAYESWSKYNSFQNPRFIIGIRDMSLVGFVQSSKIRLNKIKLMGAYHVMRMMEA